ncbi:hypothetical protein [Barnesiella viscericola]|uniref:Uncharacterized protein n=1 Tax=Barnesiella viscericola TaxID=397865 RepID=A0A921SVC8_9BACT|nr:hypothetical protein [Barnesiella viscericola]HJG89513.1 hypothetical protein [Barnesiella viscericola]
MAKKKNTYKKGRKEGMEMIAKALIIPQETFDTLLEAMIKEDKQKSDDKKKGED